MWFQTLKTRQTVKNFTTSNSHCQLVAIEYSDKKVDVHILKRETSPLSLDENTSVAFVNLEDGSIYLISVCVCVKGRSVLEFKAWDVTNNLGFMAKDITVQDMQRLNMNDSKSKAIVNLPEVSATQNPVKINSLMDYIALSVGPMLVALWKCKKVDNSFSLELVTAVRTTMVVQDIGLMFSDEDTKNSIPCLVVGGSSGAQIFSAAKSGHTDLFSSSMEDNGNIFNSIFFRFPSVDQNSVVQDIQRSSLNSCIICDNNGCLWYLTSSKLIPIHLPSSKNGNGVYAVQARSQNVPDGWLAVVQKNQTINLYKLDDVIKMSDAGQIAQPWHVIFSTCQLNGVAFIDVNTLAAGSPSNRTLSLWVGLDCIGQRKGERKQ